MSVRGVNGGEVEMIRMLKKAKDSAVKARTQALNQMKALVVTAPAELRESLDGLAAGVLASPVSRASVQVLWTVPRRPPSTLFAPLPVVSSSSAMRSAIWQPNWKDSP